MGVTLTVSLSGTASVLNCFSLVVVVEVVTLVDPSSRVVSCPSEFCSSLTYNQLSMDDHGPPRRHVPLSHHGDCAARVSPAAHLGDAPSGTVGPRTLVRGNDGSHPPSAQLAERSGVLRNPHIVAPDLVSATSPVRGEFLDPNTDVHTHLAAN